MSEYGSVIEKGSVRFERVLPGPLARVWEYLTDPKLRSSWFAEVTIDLRVGGAVELVFHRVALTPHAEEVPEKYRKDVGYKLRSEVTRLEPPRVLAFTWDESEVCFELVPRDREVVLTLAHRRLGDVDELRSVASGWHAHLELLRDVLRGATPKPYWAHTLELERDYEARIR